MTPTWVLIVQAFMWLALGFVVGMLYSRLRARIDTIDRILTKNEEERLYRIAKDGSPRPVIPERTPEWPADYVKKVE